MAATGYSSFSLEKTTFICVSVHPSEQNLEQLKTPTNNSFYIDLQSLSLTNWVTHSESSMIVLGKQVGEVWKIPRIPPRASPSEEYSEFPDFSSLFTQDYYRPRVASATKKH